VLAETAAVSAVVWAANSFFLFDAYIFHVNDMQTKIQSPKVKIRENTATTKMMAQEIHAIYKNSNTTKKGKQAKTAGEKETETEREQ